MSASSLLFSVLLVCVSLSACSAGAPWSYEGETGPQFWASLDTAYAACGTGGPGRQSPIDITPSSAVDAPFLADLLFSYSSSVPGVLLNSAENIKFTPAASAPLNTVSGGPVFSDTFKFLQFHTHSWSEHSLDGDHSDLELHFVHQHKPAVGTNGTGELLVVGFLFNQGSSANPFLASLINSLSSVQEVNSAVNTTLNLNSLLPANPSYYHYRGSLTTPPCSEIVTWVVLSDVLEATAAQIQQFVNLHDGDARPTQPLNGRNVYYHEHGSHTCPTCEAPPPTSQTQINFNFAGMIPRP